MDDDTGGSSFGIIVFVIIIIVIIAVVVYFYTRPAPTPSNSGLQPIGPSNPLVPIVPPANLPNTIENCDHYGNRVAPGDYCPAGKALFEGLCYTDVWTQQGGVKTSLCTVSYGPYGGISTSCGDFYQLNEGDPCPTAGANYHKTALCTCQLGGVVTASQYCQNASLPVSCPPGTDEFQGGCVGASCPEGYSRTGPCKCQKNGT